MSNNRILIHQAFFGAQNRRHTLLGSSLNNQNIIIELERISDKPHFSDDWQPHTIGYISEDNTYYCLMKIMPDPKAARKGMTYSHALIFDINEIIKLNSIVPIFDLLAKTPDKPQSIPSIALELALDDAYYIKPPFLPSFNNIVQALMENKEGEPLICLGYNNIDTLIPWLWYNFTPGMRRNFAFKMAERPEQVKRKYLLIFAPENSSYYWHRFNVINTFSIPLESTSLSLSAKFLCGDMEAQTFRAWIDHAGIAINDIINLKRCERTFLSIESVKHSFDAFVHSIAVRETGVLFPDANFHIDLKENLFTRFLELLEESNTHLPIIACRNLPLDAYRQGKKRIIESIEKWLAKKFLYEGSLSVSDRLTIIETITINQDNSPNWWKNPIQDFLQKSFDDPASSIIRLFYEVGLANPLVIYELEKYIPNDDNIENKFVKYLPINCTAECIQAITSLSQKKKWYLLHAYAISFYHITKETFNQQLKIDKNPNYLDGLRYLAMQIKPEEYIKISTGFDDDRFLQIASDICIANSNLLNDLSLIQWKEQRIIYYAWDKLEEKPKGMIASNLLDHLLNEGEIESNLLEKISFSSFANIYNYPNRADIWHKIPATSLEKFINATLYHVAALIDTHVLHFEEIEDDIRKFMFNSNFLLKILNNPRLSTCLKIQLIEKSNNIGDNEAREFILNFYSEMREEDEITLGRIIYDNNWTSSAITVFKIYKQYDKLYTAYLECKDLVRFSSKLFLPFKAGSKLSSKHSKSELLNKFLEEKINNDHLEKAIKDLHNALKEEEEYIEKNDFNEMNKFLIMLQSDLTSINKSRDFGTEKSKTLKKYRAKVKKAFLDFLNDLPEKYKSFCDAINRH